MLMTIGEFGERTRLSPKALRLYEQLGLVVPADVDPRSGYRRYSQDQVESAQLVGLLRRLGMPLALIGETIAMEAADAARAVTDYVTRLEEIAAERRALASYLGARLRKETTHVYDVEMRTMPERMLLTINRHVRMGETDQFFAHAFARLRGAAPGCAGIAGVPFLIFYGEVSDDGDGPIELCRPVVVETSPEALAHLPDVQLRREAAHDEAFIHLTLKEMSWPEMLPAYDALAQWGVRHQRQPAGPVRQLLIADQRTAQPDTAVCDLSVPLK
jgi:DNA-binding transcriptional MerR regulator